MVSLLKEHFKSATGREERKILQSAASRPATPEASQIHVAEGQRSQLCERN